MSRVVVRTVVENDRSLAFYRSRGFTGNTVTTEDVKGTLVEVVELDRLVR